MMMDSRKLLTLLLPTVVLAACTSARMQQADQAYDLMQYSKAERLYTKVLAHKEDRSARARLADSYRKHNALTNADAQYAILESTRPLSGDTALAYGEVKMGMKQPENARGFFLRVLEEAPENKLAMDLYASTLGYDSFYQDSSRFIVNRINLPGIVTAFGGVPYRGGLLIAGEREAGPGNANPWNERSFLDIYHCVSRTIVTWSNAEPLPGKVNGNFHEGPVALSADGRTLYFTRSNYVERRLQKDDRNTSHLKLFRAKLDSTGEWGDLHAFAYNSEDWSTGHPALTADGRTLYFVSDRPGGHGGTDIWRSTNNGSGWSAPENLGPTVNTAGNELFPTVNGSALHFSSTGHSNMGGLDIFETQEQDGIWSEPVNMNAPINTPKDDFFFVLDSTRKAGFLSSDREGLDQIYEFSLNEPVFYLNGIVLDDEDRFLPNTEVVLKDLGTGEDATLFAGIDGKFSTTLNPNSEYDIAGRRDDMLTNSKRISTKGLTRSDTLHTDVRMTPLRIGEAIAINNIYYDYDEWDIRPDAALELDKLARFFKDNPGMNFELGAHTDSRGGDLYNLVLSDARSNSAVNYLIQRGVDPDRIIAKGYGEEQLVNGCGNGVQCTEDEHQQNRRTEFKVTGLAGLATDHRR
ncbi:MAG: OmpA family protein [Flavobacteriales bacterium]|nr:OmpA family protein [Flavobacteriales bacterium]